MEIIVDQNRTVQIEGIAQWYTYDGLLEGYPTRKMNQRILKRLPEKAKLIFHISSFFLIEPTEEPIEGARNYPFGEPARMPSVTCLAELRSFRPAKHSDSGGSWVVLAWLQREFAFPPEDLIKEKMRALKWNEIAQDYWH